MQIDRRETIGIQPSIKRRIHGLDELRGVAILTVMVAHFFKLRQHSGFEDFHAGAPGVDLFFIISGFLIAKILISEKGNANYFRRFYVRRVFRILPLYTVTVVTLCTLSADTNHDFSSWPFYALFLQNFLGDPLTSFNAIMGLGPLWSLAVEEQFYLVLPLVVLFTPTRAMPVLFTIVAILGIGLKTWEHDSNTVPALWGYSNPNPTWFRMQYLAIGCLLAVEGRSVRLFAVIFLMWFTGTITTGDNIGAIECLTCLVLFYCVRRSVTDRPVLSSGWLARTGRLCFGLYLTHVPILIVFQKLSGHVGLSQTSIFLLAAYVLTAFVVAELSFRYFETPIQRYRTRFEEGEHTGSN
jgi:peptidoglycan/LPS O-acetylase OafA/YrhL